MPSETSGPRRGRGERAGLSRGRVLDAALQLVDRTGLKGLTMRALGEELQVEAMTLYHYVPNKDALLDGLVEQVFAAAAPALDHTDTTQGAPDWRAALRGYATALRTGLLRHPAVLPLAASRPAATPAALDDVEASLRMLTAAGFPLDQALHVLNTLSLFVVGHTVAEAQLSGDPGRPGGTGWLAGLQADRYPLVTRAAREGLGVDDAERFSFAVEALLLGFDALRAR
ncbi:TetR/AcrR family transcriptional regulator C-terminal domain-containing protein [Streptacidiphilus monticola]|uniref:TetR/AcrR family transcriptional regulator C-terminal domain-containing protein n=1 Tax=Streptacidiphilus monticola TaxID=2161674 RepID=A0ABW1G2J3_9ACTN